MPPSASANRLPPRWRTDHGVGDEAFATWLALTAGVRRVWCAPYGYSKAFVKAGLQLARLDGLLVPPAEEFGERFVDRRAIAGAEAVRGEAGDLNLPRAAAEAAGEMIHAAFEHHPAAPGQDAEQD